MLDALASWPAFLALLVIYGFAPRALLRLICLAFRRDDPRRYELGAELYAVPRPVRPFWVLEQLEVALFEGLGERLLWAATGRVIYRWHLESGVKRNREYPDSFWIPDENSKAQIVPGMKVKLLFEMKDGCGERMWVEVTAVKGDRLVGELSNSPAFLPRLDPGDRIRFRREHVIDIVPDSE